MGHGRQEHAYINGKCRALLSVWANLTGAVTPSASVRQYGLVGHFSRSNTSTMLGVRTETRPATHLVNPSASD